MSKPNPFEVLQLDPMASPEQIVEQAARLRQTAASEEEQNRIREAVLALTGQPEDRDLAALFTFPRPGYQLPERERFLQTFRRSPVPATAPGTSEIPPLEETELALLMLGVLSEELAAPPAPLEPLPIQETAEEIRAQQAEALWQSLLYDSRG